MSRVLLRLLGLCLLAVAIVIPGCQALFPRDTAYAPAAPPALSEDGGTRTPGPERP